MGEDEFYLPDEVVEWIEQKKSELLAWVLEHRPETDIPFEHFESYGDDIPDAMIKPDEAWEWDEDGHRLACLSKNLESGVLLLIVALKTAAVEATAAQPVYVPVLVLPTRARSWWRPLCKGHQTIENKLH